MPSALSEASFISELADAARLKYDSSGRRGKEASAILRGWQSFVDGQGFGRVEYSLIPPGGGSISYPDSAKLFVDSRFFVVPYERAWPEITFPHQLSAPPRFTLSQHGQLWDYTFHHWEKVIYETGETDLSWLPQSTNTVNIEFVPDFPNGFHYYVAHFTGGPFYVSFIKPGVFDTELVVGDTFPITWFGDEGVRNTDSVSISISRDGGVSWQSISSTLPYDFGSPLAGPGTGALNWTVTSPNSSNCRLRIVASDMVDNVDTIVSSPLAIGCSPTVDFTASTNLGVVPFTVTFTDMSSFATNATRIWDFGDGVIDTSQTDVIQHTYTTTGLKTVSLTVTNTCGSDSYTVPDMISADCLSQLSFSPQEPIRALPPVTVNFFYDAPVNLPPGTQYIYDFGDGFVDTTLFASHTYDTKGQYDMIMTIIAACGTVF